MAKQYNEAAFESSIEGYLLDEGGYERGNRDNFDPTICIDPTVLFSFIKETQPENWRYLENLQKEKAEVTLLNDLCRALDSEHEGCLKVLRHGFKCFGKTFYVAYFQPASGLNPEIIRKYRANRLTLTRQLRYSKNHGNTLDLVISLNGIPIITAELKNPMTGQTWKDGVRQYKNDRNPQDLIFNFKKRSLVHFAVDPDEAYMTTRLSGNKTYFLPFNKGKNYGAGNPENPNGHKTAYLWEEVWQRDNLMDILARFIHLQIEEKRLGRKKVKREKMIFPRYHQLDCVKKLIYSSENNGPGKNYLIQHSAGSGKSNSIAWLAHRLSSLHTQEDEKVFDSVVVVTDRLVLDQQLQDTIYQFEHKQGVVAKIEQDSTQLAEALSTGKPIIVTTIQKFPFVTEKIEELPKRNYAVIIDEAHSSQSGERSIELKGVLSGKEIEEEVEELKNQGHGDTEEQILRAIKKRGKQKNLSFYAFTATPKYKTLEFFGGEGEDGKPKPFHLYSMRQAIEENFILDVLENYTTYKTYYKLVKSIEDDPLVDKKRAAKALARFMSLHPHSIAQKTEIIVEHFNRSTRHKIGGQAKAMVVTSSRLHAVRYKQAFDKYIKEKGYNHIKSLVAFSGTVNDPDFPDIEYTEIKMNNGIKESEVPEKFASEDYQVLLVAEKYQTGFDQPLLHTMYVDKKLSGIQAVQTLSRLNRTHPGKEDTFVLDFRNEREEILEAFQPYYEKTTVGERTDYNHLYELLAKLDSYQIYFKAEVEEFCKVFYKPREEQTSGDHAKMNSCIDPAVQRFKDREEEERDEFRKTLVAYRNLYSFLSQIIPFYDTDLEKLYSYIRFLLKKLPTIRTGPEYKFDDEISLQYFRIQKQSEGAIKLEKGEEGELDGPRETGTGSASQDEVELSKLIDILNERFGTDFRPGDQLFFDSLVEDAMASDELREKAIVNSLENFGLVFSKILEDLIIERLDQNEEISAKFFNNQDFRKVVNEKLTKDVYEKIRAS